MIVIVKVERFLVSFLWKSMNNKKSYLCWFIHPNRHWIDFEARRWKESTNFDKNELVTFWQSKNHVKWHCQIIKWPRKGQVSLVKWRKSIFIQANKIHFHVNHLEAKCLCTQNIAQTQTAHETICRLTKKEEKKSFSLINSGWCYFYQESHVHPYDVWSERGDQKWHRFWKSQAKGAFNSFNLSAFQSVQS